MYGKLPISGGELQPPAPLAAKGDGGPKILQANLSQNDKMRSVPLATKGTLTRKAGQAWLQCKESEGKSKKVR